VEDDQVGISNPVVVLQYDCGATGSPLARFGGPASARLLFGSRR